MADRRSGEKITYIYTHIPAYRITQMADRRSGEKITYIYTHIPAYRITQMADCWPGKKLRYRIAQMADYWPGKKLRTYTHTSLPTGSHKWQIAGQGEKITYIYTHIPAYRIAQMADRRSGEKKITYIYTHIPAYRIAQMVDRRSGGKKSLTYTHTSLPTGSHKWQIASQGEKKSLTYTHTSLPTGSHKWQIAGQGEKITYIYTHIPAYRIAPMADRRSGRTHALAGMYCIHIHVP